MLLSVVFTEFLVVAAELYMYDTIRYDTIREAILTFAQKPTEVSLIYQHAHRFNGPLSGTTQVSRYQKGKTNLDFTEARDTHTHTHPFSGLMSELPG